MKSRNLLIVCGLVIAMGVLTGCEKSDLTEVSTQEQGIDGSEIKNQDTFDFNEVIQESNTQSIDGSEIQNQDT